jgi:hypothetical protein
MLLEVEPDGCGYMRDKILEENIKYHYKKCSDVKASKLMSLVTYLEREVNFPLHRMAVVEAVRRANHGSRHLILRARHAPQVAKSEVF